jgi:cytochrome c oxidase assembly factor CtaG
MVVHGALVTLVAPVGAVVLRHMSVPAVLAWSFFIAVQWAVHLPALVGTAPGWPGYAALEHVLLLMSAIVFWIPVLRRGAGAQVALYLFLAVPATDLIGLALMARGQPAEAVGMIVGMLPLAIAAVVATWRWLAREEEQALAHG